MTSFKKLKKKKKSSTHTLTCTLLPHQPSLLFPILTLFTSPLCTLLLLVHLYFSFFTSFLIFSVCLSDPISFCAGCRFRTRQFACSSTSRLSSFAIRNRLALTFTSNLLRAHSFLCSPSDPIRSTLLFYSAILQDIFSLDDICFTKLPSKGSKMRPFAEFTSEFGFSGL